MLALPRHRQLSARYRPLQCALVVAAMLGWAGSAACGSDVAAVTAQLSEAVEVDSDQRVTMKVRQVSRTALVGELCRKGNVQIASYGAADTEVAADFDRLPLARVLQRLLRSESYLLGLRAGPDGIARVAWVRVEGSEKDSFIGLTEATDLETELASVGAADTFSVDATLLAAAFTATSTDERSKALAAIIEPLKTDLERMEAFLAVPDEAVVVALARYERAAALLDELAPISSDPRVSAKLAAVASRLRLSGER